MTICRHDSCNRVINNTHWMFTVWRIGRNISYWKFNIWESFFSESLQNMGIEIINFRASTSKNVITKRKRKWRCITSLYLFSHKAEFDSQNLRCNFCYNFMRYRNAFGFTRNIFLHAITRLLSLGSLCSR